MLVQELEQLRHEAAQIELLQKREFTLSTGDWFVVHTKPRKENVAIENLHRQEFTVYCPLTIQPKRKRQQWQKVSEPLFLVTYSCN